jgi:outer membrane receptor protein involved in Fe transport
MSSLAIIVALVVLLPAIARGADGTVRGRITDPDSLPLPGVIVTLTPASGGGPRTSVTDQAGSYSLGAPAGRYQLKAELPGFDTPVRPVVVGTAPVVVNLTMNLASHQEQVTVTGVAAQPVVSDPHPDAPQNVPRQVLDASMLPNSQYDDVLPLLPNVVRGPDGQISVAGARAPQGALLVNGFNHSDPVGGAGAILLPLEAVDSMEEFSGSYTAEFGHATGGVTSVHTQSGADRFHVSANSFFPRIRFGGGPPHGVESWEPNVGASGPLIKGRVFFEQAVSYRFDQNRFTTLAGEQVNDATSLMSWSQIDVQASRSQRLTAWLSVNPQATDHANITAFTPAASVPAIDHLGWSTGLADRVTIGERATLEWRTGLVRTSLQVTPGGDLTAPYTIGHDMFSGSYYDRKDLRGDRVESSAALAWTLSANHLLKFGASVAHASLGGTDSSAPVDMLASDGSIVRTVQFLGGPRLVASEFETGAFVQDTWKPLSNLTIDAGVRYDRTSGSNATLTPRVAWTWKLPDAGSTLSGSVGMFADKLPLLARAFPLLQPRLVETFAADGSISSARLFTNVIDGPQRMPVATRWDIELDHRFPAGVQVRLKYQERYGTNEPVVEPTALSDTTGLLALDSIGKSQSRSLEATVAWRVPGHAQEVYVSYVRSATRANLNSFDTLEGILTEPFIQTDGIGPMPADVPNRLLAWGMFHLPARITVAPFLEVRDGFPYTAVDELWNNVGTVNGHHLPRFASLDLYVNKVVSLPHHLPDARIGIKLYSLASTNSQRDVQRDIARADFGATYNAIPRDFTAVLELLWGKK